MIERDRASEFTPSETPSVFSPVHRNGNYSTHYSISKSIFGKHSRFFIIVTRISVYLTSIWTSKYALFEIKIFRNSDFASCAKISVSKITHYTVYNLSVKVQRANNVLLAPLQVQERL